NYAGDARQRPRVDLPSATCVTVNRLLSSCLSNETMSTARLQHSPTFHRGKRKCSTSAPAKPCPFRKLAKCSASLPMRSRQAFVSPAPAWASYFVTCLRQVQGPRRHAEPSHDFSAVRQNDGLLGRISP